LGENQKPQVRFLTSGKDRFFSLSTAPDGRKIKISLTDAMTRLILNNTLATCGFRGRNAADTPFHRVHVTTKSFSTVCVLISGNNKANI